jgi:hypothetical protein
MSKKRMENQRNTSCGGEQPPGGRLGTHRARRVPGALNIQHTKCLGEAASEPLESSEKGKRCGQSLFSWKTWMTSPALCGSYVRPQGWHLWKTGLSTGLCFTGVQSNLPVWELYPYAGKGKRRQEYKADTGLKAQKVGQVLRPTVTPEDISH